MGEIAVASPATSIDKTCLFKKPYQFTYFEWHFTMILVRYYSVNSPLGFSR